MRIRQNPIALIRSRPFSTSRKALLPRKQKSVSPGSIQWRRTRRGPRIEGVETEWVENPNFSFPRDKDGNRYLNPLDIFGNRIPYEEPYEVFDLEREMRKAEMLVGKREDEDMESVRPLVLGMRGEGWDGDWDEDAWNVERVRDGGGGEKVGEGKKGKGKKEGKEGKGKKEEKEKKEKKEGKEKKGKKEKKEGKENKGKKEGKQLELIQPQHPLAQNKSHHNIAIFAQSQVQGKEGKEGKEEKEPEQKEEPEKKEFSYAFRWETKEPRPDQLDKAEKFFTKEKPAFLWSAAKFKQIDYGQAPEVAFLGRSNVGKSSLLNALLNAKGLAITSSKPGRTRLMNAFGINENKIVLLDMPGYGHASKEEWGIQIMKYLKSRKQFRRAFVLVDAKHGMKETDHQFFEFLGSEGIPYQIVFSKVDRVYPNELDAIFQKTKTYLTENKFGTSALGELLGTAGDPAKKKVKQIGINQLRWAIMVAAGFDRGR